MTTFHSTVSPLPRRIAIQSSQWRRGGEREEAERLHNYSGFLFCARRPQCIIEERAAKSGALAWQTRCVFAPPSSVFRHSHVQTYHPSPLPSSPLFAPRPHVKDDGGGKQGTQQRAGNPVLWRGGHATQRQIGWGSVQLAEQPDEFTISLLRRD